MKTLSVELKGKKVYNAMYKRSIDMVDDLDNPLLLAPETPGIVGQFKLTNKTIFKRLASGKMVKLYLQMDPANEDSKAPSKRFFIGTFSAK